MVEAAAKKAEPGAWITGRGWHQERWAKTPEPSVDGVPLHHELSRGSPANPVLLRHASGHANARALELAGITRDTANPPGGEIVRDSQGNPPGSCAKPRSGRSAREATRSRYLSGERWAQQGRGDSTTVSHVA